MSAACLLLSEQARLAALDLPPSHPGVVTGRGHVSYECRVLRQVEEVGDDPSLGSWPAPLGFHWASVVQAFVSCCIAGRMAC